MRSDNDRKHRPQPASIGDSEGATHSVEEVFPSESKVRFALDDEDQGAFPGEVLQEIIQSPDLPYTTRCGDFREWIGERPRKRRQLGWGRFPAFSSLASQGLEKPAEPAFAGGAGWDAEGNQRPFPKLGEHLGREPPDPRKPRGNLQDFSPLPP